uniref:Uncharacterized protein n=1 Tax=Zooxanthella nutricula TaxID=1333877 RepID=A0A7S2M3Y8_9DINO|mmetsp:Transcript_71570/g.219218  ORF Transcript_71570/g.219218 Transcript_71570/m.219218 type:complete len:135 (+) Transcript_71570:1-405(+)
MALREARGRRSAVLLAAGVALAGVAALAQVGWAFAGATQQPLGRGLNLRAASAQAQARVATLRRAEDYEGPMGASDSDNAWTRNKRREMDAYQAAVDEKYRNMDTSQADEQSKKALIGLGGLLLLSLVFLYLNA